MTENEAARAMKREADAIRARLARELHALRAMRRARDAEGRPWYRRPSGLALRRAELALGGDRLELVERYLGDARRELAAPALDGSPSAVREELRARRELAREGR